ncbi:MAG: hypothetical protein AAGD23_07670 [Pseudomonadota bacterium]
MNVSRRFVLLGTASAVAMGVATTPRPLYAALKVGEDGESKKLLTQMVRMVYPHDQFPDGCYERTADAIVAAANKSIGKAVMFKQGMASLQSASFGDLDEAAATKYLKGIEDTAFFQLVRGTAVVALYDDHEVWEILGYEGASFDQGGYINRGFNDLDWLPDPRITES